MVDDRVETTQIAPTILRLLGLDPAALEAVRIEGTAVLPAPLTDSVDAANVGGAAMSHPLRVLLVSGSLRDGSTNTAALRTARAVAPTELRGDAVRRDERAAAFQPGR